MHYSLTHTRIHYIFVWLNSTGTVSRTYIVVETYLNTNCSLQYCPHHLLVDTPRD